MKELKKSPKEKDVKITFIFVDKRTNLKYEFAK